MNEKEITSLYAFVGVYRSVASEKAIDRIKEAVLDVFKITEDQMLSPTRTRALVDARICFANQATRRTRLAKVRIAKEIGRDHSTVIHYERLHNNIYGSDKKYTQRFDDVSSLLDGVILVSRYERSVKTRELPPLGGAFLLAIKKVLSSVTGVNRDDVLAKNKMWGNGLYLYMIFDFLRSKGYTNKQIGEYLDRDPHTVGSGIKKLEDYLQFDESLRLDRSEIFLMLERDFV